jgi:hypothetical protein
MERRTALALAVAAAGTVLAGSAAFAANVGLLENEAKPTSVLDTSSIETTTTLPQDPTVVTVIVEDPPVADAGVPAVDPALTPPPSTVAQSYDDYDDDEYDDDDEYEDSEHEDEYEDSEDHESDDDD